MKKLSLCSGVIFGFAILFLLSIFSHLSAQTVECRNKSIFLDCMLERPHCEASFRTRCGRGDKVTEGYLKKTTPISAIGYKSMDCQTQGIHGPIKWLTPKKNGDIFSQAVTIRRARSIMEEMGRKTNVINLPILRPMLLQIYMRYF